LESFIFPNDFYLWQNLLFPGRQVSQIHVR
jgi:hypothetical protein